MAGAAGGGGASHACSATANAESRPTLPPAGKGPRSANLLFARRSLYTDLRELISAEISSAIPWKVFWKE